MAEEIRPKIFFPLQSPYQSCLNQETENRKILNFSLLFIYFFYSGPSTIKGNYWFYYTYLTFQIFSRNAVDGTPVQYGDIVGFKYPYSSNSAWLYYYSYYFYARSCSTHSKSSCAAPNKYTGFRIFKRLWPRMLWLNCKIWFNQTPLYDLRLLERF